MAAAGLSILIYCAEGKDQYRRGPKPPVKARRPQARKVALLGLLMRPGLRGRLSRPVGAKILRPYARGRKGQKRLTGLLLPLQGP